jgi:uncharacterized protein YdiU (UPF0061 family)
MPFAATLTLDQRFTAELPGDPQPANTRRQVLGAAWSPVAPTPVAAPRLLAWAPDVAAQVGFSPADIHAPEFPQLLGGNLVLPGMRPYSACYGGHQFGQWAGQLGDGRAITLAEGVGEGGARWELQLKGAGPTPYSRTADGRAVLRSSLREFLCSEAMHALGVPTTRALALVATGEAVVRDILYRGDPQPEPGAITSRVAPSFLRFGSYELPTARGDQALLERLVAFTIARDFPHLAAAHPGDLAAQRAAWFAEVCTRTAVLMAHWMRVGFVHGVMNTDNLSVLGLTIDYGPYGWVEAFDPHFTPNTTDAGQRRYRFGQQPAVAQWNLVRLAEALLPLFPDDEPLATGLAAFDARFQEDHRAFSAAKLGLAGAPPEAEEAVGRLVREGYALLYDTEADHTRFFRALGALPLPLPEGSGALDRLGDCWYDPIKRDQHAEALLGWLERWGALVARTNAHLGRADADRQRAMHAVNPKYLPRNYLAQEAIQDAARGDLGRLRTLQAVLARPYDDQPAHDALAARRPDWARHVPGCAMLSCSS